MTARLAAPLMAGLLLLPADGLADGDPVARLVVFGPEASPGKGDDDFKEVVYLRVPKGTAGPLYLRLFDPDIGGAEDEPNGPWSTRTHFALLGGPGAGEGPHPGREVGGGEVLAETEIGADPATDGLWHNFASFRPEQGEEVDGVYVFRFVATGRAGDDGNVIDLAVSSSAEANVPVPGAQLRSFRPTISVPPMATLRTDARFRIPAEATAIEARAFDLDRARIALERPFSKTTMLQSSGDAAWSKQRIELEPGQSGGLAALAVQGGRRLQNDVVLEVLDQEGRPIPFELPIRMREQDRPPAADLRQSPGAECRSVVFDASGSDGFGHQLVEYRWDFGDGQQGRGAQVEHRYREPGSYLVSLTVVDDSGRVLDRSRAAAEVKVNRPPDVPDLAELTLAPGQAAQLSAAGSRDLDGRIRGYTWDFGDGRSARGERVSHAYAGPGRYEVALVAEDDGPGPCSSSRATTKVWVNAAPQPEAGPDQAVAVGETVRLDASASRDTDGRIRGYSWDFGDGSTGEGSAVEHAYRAAGHYRVRLTVTDDADVSNSRVEDQLSIRVNDPPVAVIASADRGSVGEPVQLDASGSTDADGTLTGYQWDFGDGSQGTGAQVAHAYETPGTYRIKLVVTDSSGTRSSTASAERDVVINAPPIADAGPDQLVTASLARLDGSGSRDPDGEILSWHWDFGDGTEGEGPTPSHVYSVPGTYEVVLRVRDDSGTSSDTAQDRLQIRVNAKPTADAGPDQLVEPGQKVDFDGAGSVDPDGTITAYFWDFGDGASGQGAQASHVYDRPGLYNLGLRVQDDSGHAQAYGASDAQVRVNAPPVALAGEDRRVAPGERILLDGSGSYDPDVTLVSYSWRLSDRPAASWGPQVDVTLEEPGLVTATLEVADDSGLPNSRGTDELEIRVNQSPRAVAAGPVTQCSPLVELDGSASRDPDGDQLSYRWDFGDGRPAGRGAVVRHNYASAGRFPVILTVDDGSGLANSADRTATEVLIHRPPIAVAEAPRLACAGEVVLFNGAKSQAPDGGQLLYTWDFGDGSSAQSVSPAKAYEEGGSYTVTLDVQDDSGLPCNGARDRIALLVADAPVADAGPDVTVCAGAPVTFDGTGSRDSDGVVNAFDWDFGDGTKGGGARPTHLFAAAGEYRTMLRITGDQIGECSSTNTDEVRVTVLDAPSLDLQGPRQAPVGGRVRLEAVSRPRDNQSAGPELHYRWDLGDGTSADGRVVEHEYREPGRYQIRLTADDGRGHACSQAERLHAIRVNAPPKAVAAAIPEVAPGQSASFDASESADPDGAIAQYLWDFGDDGQGEGPLVRHAYAEPGRYQARLTVVDDAALDNSASSVDVEVRVNAPPVPEIGWSPRAPCPKETLTFDAAGSKDPDGRLLDSSWDLGDGTEATGDQVVHAYERPGRYPVTLTLRDDSPAPNSIAIQLEEIRVNEAPRALIGGQMRGCPGEEILFDGSASYDPDGAISAYEWSLGDGSSAEGARATHTYARSGLYQVDLRVEDDSGSHCADGLAHTEVAVNGAPRAHIELSSRIAYLDGANEDIQLDGTESEDPDGDPLVYVWDFGDGTSGRGPRVSHRYTKPGLYRPVLRVTDDSGTPCASATARAEVEVRSSRSPP